VFIRMAILYPHGYTAKPGKVSRRLAVSHLSIPDLAIPDLAIPDLAIPDLA